MAAFGDFGWIGEMDALGPAGAIHCDANGNWDLDTAAAVIPALDRAAGGLEFV